MHFQKSRHHRDSSIETPPDSTHAALLETSKYAKILILKGRKTSIKLRRHVCAAYFIGLPKKDLYTIRIVITATEFLMKRPTRFFHALLNTLCFWYVQIPAWRITAWRAANVPWPNPGNRSAFANHVATFTGNCYAARMDTYTRITASSWGPPALQRGQSTSSGASIASNTVGNL